MKGLLAVCAAAFAFCLAVCDAEPASSGLQATDTPAPVPSSVARASSTHPSAETGPTDSSARWPDGELDKGMAYNEFRKLALDHGWQPKPDKQCTANVVGGDHETWCPAHPDDVMCKVCKEVPELSSCSGDGHCLMQFTHEGKDRDLAVGTYGDINTWNAPADKSRLMVTGWEYSAPETH